jgi:hypothetical protein
MFWLIAVVRALWNLSLAAAAWGPPPPAPPPPPKSSRFFVGIIGCAGLLLLLVAVGAGITSYLVLKEEARPTPRDEVKYASVKDSRTGPSVVKVSGKSGKQMTTRRGIIKPKAKQVQDPEDLKFPANPKYCKSPELLTDVFKDIVFDVDREMRKSSRMSEAEEMDLGQKVSREVAAMPQFQGKIDTTQTARWRAYIARVAQPILAETKRKKIVYKFHVIDQPIVNAFAIPGGHIYFFTGMLDNDKGTWLENEAQLAAILAHEISHIDLGHCSALYEYLKKFGLSGKKGDDIGKIAVAMARHSFSSAQEDEADENATKMVYYAQYSPNEFVKLWKNWQKLEPKRKEGDPLMREVENLLRSHSEPRKRACNVMRVSNVMHDKDRFDVFYVGKSNFKKKKPRTQRQY